MSTKYYFHAVAADRQLFATIAAGRKFWLLVATGKLISIIYLLYLLKKGKKTKGNYYCYIYSEINFATDDIGKIK